MLVDGKDLPVMSNTFEIIRIKKEILFVLERAPHGLQHDSLIKVVCDEIGYNRMSFPAALGSLIFEKRVEWFKTTRLKLRAIL